MTEVASPHRAIHNDLTLGLATGLVVWLMFGLEFGHAFGLAVGLWFSSSVGTRYTSVSRWRRCADGCHGDSPRSANGHAPRACCEWPAPVTSSAIGSTRMVGTRTGCNTSTALAWQVSAQ